MGRSRQRQTADERVAARSTTAARRTESPRRLLGAYLGGATGVALVALIGTMALVGTLAPWLVLIVVVVGAVGVQSRIGLRVGALSLTDEDRVLQTLAGGLLVLSVVFALVAAVVLTASR